MRNLIYLISLTWLCQACDEPASSMGSITIVQNGVTRTSLQPANLATIYFDIAHEAIESVEKTGDHTMRSPLGGSVEVEGQTAGEEKQFSLIFNKLILREGYPIFKSGELEVNLQYSATSIRGSLRGKRVEVGEAYVTDFDLEYDLHLWQSFWRGHMNGTIEINGDAYLINHDYDAPVLLSVETNKTQVRAGEVLSMKVRANSNSPVRFMNTLISPLGARSLMHLPSLSRQIEFQEVSKGVWEHTHFYDIRSTLPSGKYVIDIFVENDAELKSSRWNAAVVFEVLNGVENPDALEIKSVTLSPSPIQNGGKVTAQFTFKSGRVPLGVSAFLTGPQDYLESITGNGEFRALSEDLWIMESDIQISEWAPAGVYQVDSVIAYHEDASATYDRDPVTIEVQNTKVAMIPVITDLELLPNEGKEETFTRFRVRARSNAPIDLLTADIQTPRKNREKMLTSKVVSLGNDEWEILGGTYVWKDSPKGIYEFKNIRVRNEGNLYSEPFGPIRFQVER